MAERMYPSFIRHFTVSHCLKFDAEDDVVWSLDANGENDDVIFWINAPVGTLWINGTVFRE